MPPQSRQVGIARNRGNVGARRQINGARPRWMSTLSNASSRRSINARWQSAPRVSFASGIGGAFVVAGEAWSGDNRFRDLIQLLAIDMTNAPICGRQDARGSHVVFRHGRACPGHPRRDVQRRFKSIAPSGAEKAVEVLIPTRRLTAWMPGTSPGMTDKAAEIPAETLNLAPMGACPAMTEQARSPTPSPDSRSSPPRRTP
jgi:hypothetical protein